MTKTDESINRAYKFPTGGFLCNSCGHCLGFNPNVICCDDKHSLGMLIEVVKPSKEVK